MCAQTRRSEAVELAMWEKVGRGEYGWVPRAALV